MLTALLLAAPAAAHKAKSANHAKAKCNHATHKPKTSCKHAANAKFVHVLSGSAARTITALSTSSIRVHTDDNEVTCTLGSASPKLGDYRVGGKVKLACTDGVLTAIARLAPPPANNVRTFVGTLVSFSDASATFHTENGDVTCTRNGSPTLGDFHAGDHVKAACTSGVLTAIAKLEPPPAPAPQVVTRLATITSLTDGSVTVRNGDGDLTCTRNATSPSLDGYAVGDHVKATCVNDVLTAIAHL